MLAKFNSLNAHNFTIFQAILMILVSKFMVHKALSDKTYLSLGLLSSLRNNMCTISEAVLPINNNEQWSDLTFNLPLDCSTSV